MDYKIADVSRESPDMPEGEFNELVEDIRQKGQMVPIVVRGEEVIDGRKRLAACQRLGIQPRVIDLSSDQSPEELAYSLNVLRTHYTASQRAMFAARRANYPLGKAKSGSEGIPSPRKAREVAAEVGVDRTSVVVAKRVLRDGAQEVAAAVEGGNLTLHAAEQIVIMVPKPEQAAAVERVVKASKGKKRQTTTKVLGLQKRFKSSPRRPLGKRMARVLDQLENAVEQLSEYLAEKDAGKQGEFDKWMKRVRQSRARLTQVLNKYERRSK